MADGQDHSQDADWIEGLPLPREQTALVGHDAAARTLHEAYAGGRMHHAWLIAGPKGIGKATLAFRFARFALSHPDRDRAPPPEAGLLPADPGVVAKVATGAHPNVLHLRRPWDEQAKKLKTVLTVDEVRRTVSFLGNSAGSRGDRIVVVDAADDMNPNAANALLKLLEEPPNRAMFLVISHAPGALLPTIRSRCRRLALSPLGEEDLSAALETLGLEVDPASRAQLAAIAEGSVRRAVECLESDGLALFGAFASLAEGFPALPRKSLHRFAELATGRRGSDHFGLVADFARSWLRARMHAGLSQPGADVRRCAEIWDTVNRIEAETETLNLDRKQAVMTIIQSLAECARH
ncbi:DNA polymerase III subunit delta' [Chthonobacter rhizosphaerae]|uniref:DNA polymerase III subunit delta' n=1 Tax=Chthonobacter rhizosphaerae TaxID=2735553 RepID=UPI001AEE5568